MDITLDKKNATEATIKITLKQDDYQPKVEQKLKEYAKNAQLKGFRPGKVPKSLIQKMYGKSILVEEVNHLLAHSVMDYIRDEKIRILGEPLPNLDKAGGIDWDHQAEFEFEYEIGFVNEFDVDIEGKTVTGYSVEVDDDTLNETLDNLKMQNAKQIDVDKSEAEDMVYGELSAKEGEFNDTITITVAELKEDQREAFVGVAKEDAIAIADIHALMESQEALVALLGRSAEEVEALSGEFEFTVKNINRKVPSEMDQEFFDKVFGINMVSSEEEFVGKVKEEVGKSYAKETDIYTNIQLRDVLLQGTEIELPDGFMKKWMVASSDGKVTEEDAERDYEDYSKDLRWSLIISKVAELNDIQVAEEDLRLAAVATLRQQLGGVIDQLGEDSLSSFADNMLQDEEQRNRLANQAMSDKVMVFMREKATIEPKEVSPKEFQEAVAN